MPEPRKLILKTFLALGDVVCFTVAVHELHRQYPGYFLTDVRTPFPDLWENNADITPLDENAADVEQVEVHYDRDPYVSVNRSNEHPIHLIEAYCADLANSLGLPSLRPKVLQGHVYLSAAEDGQQSIPHQYFNCQRYWLVCAGGKTDFTTKHWIHGGYQQVVNHFIGRIQFVQVGALADGHTHEPLANVIDLRGKTNLRQLIHTVHASCGVLCGVTGLMHLAAAVPCPAWQKRPRPCVVIAGGREPRTWYGYQTHRILETVGSLPCCSTGGCWQSHTVPIGTPDEQATQRLCHRVVNSSPKCMWMIRPEEVIFNIEKYLGAEGVE